MLKLHRFSDEQLAEQLKAALHKEGTYWRPARALPCAAVAAASALANGGGAEQMTALVTAAERDEMVAYLQEVCERDDIEFGAATFALAVTLLDRFLAAIKVKNKYLECVAVACLYVACKVREEDECVSITSEFLQDCDAKCSIAELLRMEQMICTKFEWCVDDANIADFVYLYHAMLVNRWNACHLSVSRPVPGNKRKWMAMEVEPSMVPTPESTNEVSRYHAPAELDILHLLEHQLKQCLCVSELTGVYKPHLLAYALCALQMNRIDVDDTKEMQTLLRYIRFYVKDSDEMIAECMEAVEMHLSSMEATNSMFDRFMGEHLSFHRIRRPSMITFHRGLSVIKEEEEEESECYRHAKITKQATYAEALLSSSEEYESKFGHHEVEREV